ncbi:NosD domain-containing protein, partial [Haloferax profundi]|uniref:NosD domain-containing protein n=1 Tax=Haloferax profundi TaxID=1544718 RepID=UPI0018D1FF42
MFILAVCGLVVLSSFIGVVPASAVTIPAPSDSGTGDLNDEPPTAMLGEGLFGDDTQITAESSLVVAADGSEEYTSIQNAVDNASDGGRIVVQPGTYREPVTLEKDVTIVAPDGAVLNGSGISDDGFEIYRSAAPTISGFTITGWSSGIYVFLGTGNWTVRNTTITNNSHGIYVGGAERNWTVSNSTITNNRNHGIAAPGSEYIGNATGNYWGSASGPTIEQCTGNVDCGYFASTPNATPSVPEPRPPTLVVGPDGDQPYASIGDAISASAAGDVIEVQPGTYRERVDLWKDVTVFAPNGATLNGSKTGGSAFLIESDVSPTISGFTITDYYAGIRADTSDGDWTATNNTFTDNTNGIYSEWSDGNWTATNNTITENTHGIYVEFSYGNWTAANGTIANNTEQGVYAWRSSVGDATGNYWGQSTGPTLDQCYANVDCGFFRSTQSEAPSVPAVRPATVVVAQDGSGNYSSIRDALYAVADGDSIAVRPGTYNQPISLLRNITLFAPKGAVLEAPNDFQTGIEISSDAS